MIVVGLWGLVALGFSLGLTLLCERVAPRVGLLAHPRGDRWHGASVPLLGGLAIAAGTLVPLTLATWGTSDLLVLSVAALAMTALGLVDDIYSLKPQLKFTAQVTVAAVLLYSGFLLRLTPFPLLNIFITLGWIVGITNAFNLLDNMDGLAAGIAAIAAAFRLLFSLWEGEAADAVAAATFLGGCVGFLARNFHPARIFMGDAGSHFLGFFLAGLSLTARFPYSRGTTAVLALPVLLLLVPIFDTTFVTVTRLLSGRRVSVGGRDHTSHRLVAVGISQRGVVLFFYGVAASSGAVALISYQVGLSYSVALLGLLVLGLVLLGVYLAGVRGVAVAPASGSGTVLRLVADFQYKRQVLTVSLDLALIVMAYYLAYLLRFEEAMAGEINRFLDSLPIVLVSQLVVLVGFGLYQGVWRYAGLRDFLRIVWATAVGTMGAVVFLVLVYRFEGFSRAVFILDWLLLVVLISGSRVSFRLFGELFRRRPPDFQRVLIYGAGDGGELTVRELLNNPALERVPVGFLDDDRGKQGAKIHGLPVFGGVDSLDGLIAKHLISEVIVSSSKIQGESLRQLTDRCRVLGLPVRRASLQLE